MRIGFWTLWTILASMGASAFGVTEGFDRYRVIVERKPFGEPPPVVEAPPPPTEKIPPWAETYRLCSVYETDDKETRVGLLETGTNKALILSVGEAQNGILLVSADVTDESAVLTKNGEQITMKLEGSKRRSVAAKPAAAGKAKPAATRITPPGQSSRPVPARGGIVRPRRK